MITEERKRIRQEAFEAKIAAQTAVLQARADAKVAIIKAKAEARIAKIKQPSPRRPRVVLTDAHAVIVSALVAPLSMEKAMGALQMDVRDAGCVLRACGWRPVRARSDGAYVDRWRPTVSS